MSWFWLIVRVYVGWQWFQAGYAKINESAWTGKTAGTALSGFIKSTHDVSPWYHWFLYNAVLPHVHNWSFVVAYGELFVGIGLLLGAFTFLSAFFGFFMNMNYLLAGTVSINPELVILSLGIMLASDIAGWIGVDRILRRFFKRHG